MGRKRIHPERVITTIGYNHLEPGAPGNIKPYRVCGGETRNEVTQNEFCQRPAGWGTSHPGAGRCKFHGGATPMKPDRYTVLFRDRLADIFKKRMELTDDDPLDLLPELQMQQFLVMILIDRMNGVDPGVARPEDSPGTAAAREYYVKSGGTLHDSATQSENTVAGGGGGINDNSMVPMVNPFTDLLKGEGWKLGEEEKEVLKGTLVIPPGERKPITVDPVLFDQIRLALQDVVTTVTRVTTMRNQSAMTKAEVIWMLSTMKEVMEKYVPKPYVSPIDKLNK